jgi:hypothetical protein
MAVLNAFPKSLDGPVAQLVEQGTENPCVGGSSPPWATILRPLLVTAAALSLTGCGADACETLCIRTTTRLAQCLEQWSASWEDLGADDRVGFREQCENDWARTRADLEPREVNLAVDACDEGVDLLLETQGCDELRALYLD